jgi:hypothetical protein
MSTVSRSSTCMLMLKPACDPWPVLCLEINKRVVVCVSVCVCNVVPKK